MVVTDPQMHDRRVRAVRQTVSAILFLLQQKQFRAILANALLSKGGADTWEAFMRKLLLELRCIARRSC